MSDKIQFSEAPVGATGLDAKRILVLNADYRPISYYPLSTASWQQIMFLYVKGMTTGIKRFHIVEYYDDGFVHCGTDKNGNQSEIQLPSVIAHKQYLPPPKRVPMTKTNLALRDDFTCQYSGEVCFMGDLSWDHVIPQSQGGKTSWDNIVAAKQKINELKDDMSVNEFEKRHGYTLRTKPRTPTWGELYNKGRKYPPKYIHETWEEYLYWEDK